MHTTQPAVPKVGAPPAQTKGRLLDACLEFRGQFFELCHAIFATLRP